MKRLIVAAMTIVGATAVMPADAHADWRVVVGVTNAHYDRGPGGGGPAFRHGYDRGWREGSEEGYGDGRRRRDPRFWREGEYRDSDRGYRGWMGPRWDYAAGFRQGYEAGYRRAYASARRGGDRRGRDGWDDRYGRPNDRGRYEDDWSRNDHR